MTKKKYYMVDVDPDTGYRQRISVEAKDKKEAIKKLRRAAALKVKSQDLKIDTGQIEPEWEPGKGPNQND